MDFDQVLAMAFARHRLCLFAAIYSADLIVLNLERKSLSAFG
jgi:hypothetical protein